ncbi:DNA directed DNA polymerase [Caudoviricetes sp.]|nr:DNA directed DNA polymerase [Caudoviricetes sp.]UOF79109.1 DNA directed DNA polymerase [Caudoviricetes sp.]
MTDNLDVMDFFHSHDVHGKIKEKDNLYIECPSCTKQNLSVELTTGSWHCWTANCDLKDGGSFKQLASHLNLPTNTHISFRQKKTNSNEEKKMDAAKIEALEIFKANKADIIEWATKRSIDPKVAMDAGVGYDPINKAVVYSYKDEKGKLIGYKCKADYGQWIVGREPLLYTTDPQDLKKEKLVLVEGEADLLTLKSMGIPAAATLGAAKDKGFALLATTRRIFIGYDMDPAGQAGGQAAAEKLGLYKCRRVEWLDKDVNDWVTKGKATKQDIFDALSKATKYLDISNVLSAKDAVNDYFEQHEAGLRPRRSWGWKKLDAFTKGWSGGELMAVQAESNTGKTTWLLNVMTNLAIQKINCALVSLEEHPIFEITPKLYSCVLGKNISTYGLSRADAASVESELKHIHLYKDKPDLTKVIDFIRECYYNHDVKCVAVDYFQLLVTDEESTQNIKDTIWAFKNITIELPDLMVLLVVQPKQIDQPQDNERNKDGTKKRKKKLGGWSMRGGAAINQTLDKCLIISGVQNHPNVTQYEYTKCRGHLDVSKSDWLNRQMQMEYDHDSMRMIEKDQLIYDF